ncbi:MAG TPA: DUF4845 domain-containing protein [Steroidobacteraceae bacterium]|nr:DUF4845 domain-containing protein [Steroidobacteraceae bacterium]
MRQRQRGATFIGMVVIIAILGFGLYGAIRLTPLFFEYMAVVRALDQTAKEHSGGPTNPNELRTSLDRRWTIEDIKSIDPKDIEIKKTGGGWTMRAWYRAEAPFIANVSLVVDFDKTVTVSQ